MLLNEPTPKELLGDRRSALDVIEARIDGKNRAERPMPDAERRAPALPTQPQSQPQSQSEPQSQTQPRQEPPNPDRWSDLLLRRPLPPAPVDAALDLLAPVLNRPLSAVDQPPLPPASDLAAIHRAELESDFAAPPGIGAGAEPAVPARFAAGLSVLPHIEFPP